MANESDFREHLKPGKHVWIRVKDPDNAPPPDKKTKKLNQCSIYGSDGDLVFSGYQALGTATFLIFDRVSGTGKRGNIETIMINAVDVVNIGVIDQD